MKILTAKQQTFVDEYLIDLNGTQAAIRAGYSKNTAASQATRLLINANIASALRKAADERAKRTQIDADWVLLELKRQYEKADTSGEISAALNALEKIGKHNQVQAFADPIVSLSETPKINIVINRPAPSNEFSDA